MEQTHTWYMKSMHNDTHTYIRYDMPDSKKNELLQVIDLTFHKFKYSLDFITMYFKTETLLLEKKTH